MYTTQSTCYCQVLLKLNRNARPLVLAIRVGSREFTDYYFPVQDLRLLKTEYILPVPESGWGWAQALRLLDPVDILSTESGRGLLKPD